MTELSTDALRDLVALRSTAIDIDTETEMDPETMARMGAS